MGKKNIDLKILSTFREAYVRLSESAGTLFTPEEKSLLIAEIRDGMKAGLYKPDQFGNNKLLRNMVTAQLLCEQIDPDRDMILAVLLADLYSNDENDGKSIAKKWGDDVGKLIRGLHKVSAVYRKTVAAQSDNFRNLLLTFAEDIRVIIIMIVDRLTLMRSINHHPDERSVKDVAFEVSYLYAPLAHRLGLYAIKGELEDLSLKYSNREVFTEIAHKLNATKVKRDAYIADFIGPVKAELEKAGLKFDIKGRTKSIYSIWNKMQKQHNDVDKIYDLFAIRVIIDTDENTTPAQEKAQCWLAFSIVTDMYQPNPARMKDWISVPKTNGYESLHTTVLGPEGKWVEVQIRTRRMDLVAEKGLAAHWRYKEGSRTDHNSLDDWMKNVRDILEAAESGPMELVKNMKMDMYKEVFVFTPKGDLFKLPMGASVLDFAFLIHSRLGCQCVGAKVNGRTCKINYKLQSGDTIEVLTSAQQTPKLDWLNFVVTGKARTKIRQTLNEQKNRTAEMGRELLQRRFKNRKIDLQESVLMKLIKRRGFKQVTDFFDAIASERLDVNDVIYDYEEEIKKADQQNDVESAGDFRLPVVSDDEKQQGASDVLVIGDHIKGLNYKFAKCCNPIYGDDVFGFISSEGVVKIHKSSCPNAANIRTNYPYRIINTKWSGKGGTQFWTSLRVVGTDDKGIVTNITSILNKEKDVTLRSISIDSHDGIFHGFITVGVLNRDSLVSVIKKIKTVKGVKDVTRSN